MSSKTSIMLGAVLMFAAAHVAAAQQEQWLHYATTAGSANAYGNTGSQQAAVTDKAPAGVDLPPFNSDKPLFFLWKAKIYKASPRQVQDGGAPTGQVWMALDQSRKGGPYDLLYADANVEGSLAHAKLVKATEVADIATKPPGLQVMFRHVEFLLPGEDGPTAWHMSLSLYFPEANAMPHLTITSAGWYEGEVTVGGQKLWCVLIDNNANGCFNDSGTGWRDGDMIRLAPIGDTSCLNPQTDTTTRFLGKDVQVGAKLYPVEVSPDGAWVKFGPAASPPTGVVRLPEGVDRFSAFGPMGHFILEPNASVVSLPLGQYHVARWQLTATDKDGVRWQVRDNADQMEPVFTVTEANEVRLGFCDKLNWNVSAQKNGPEYTISQAIQTPRGDYLSLTRSGQQPPPPKVRIVSADGTYDKTFTMEYG